MVIVGGVRAIMVLLLTVVPFSAANPVVSQLGTSADNGRPVVPIAVPFSVSAHGLVLCVRNIIRAECMVNPMSGVLVFKLLLCLLMASPNRRMARLDNRNLLRIMLRLFRAK